MKILILGAGISGHTAALVLQKKLKGTDHKVTVVTPNSKWNWIPSNIWVGVGVMKKADVTFELAPIYKRLGVEYIQAKAIGLYPEGSDTTPSPFVEVQSTSPDSQDQVTRVEYDFLINATGPKLKFEATPGLGPHGGYTESVCTADHAVEAAKKLSTIIERLRAGEKLTLVVGTGHGTCTCEGAAFEYIFNVDFELNRAGVRDNAKLVYLTNEAHLGDFGVDGLFFETGGYVNPSRVFTESLFAEKNIEPILGSHVYNITPDTIEYENLEGEKHSLKYDFAMLLPPFSGVPLEAFDKSGQDIKSRLFNPSGFMKVDGDYNPKKYEDWSPEDWPKTYQTCYPNIFSVGIAFAPPHQISQPRTSKNGTNITPSPPRTGMPSAIMARAVADSIVDMIKNNSTVPTHEASMAMLGAACVASAGASLTRGSAASMTMFPIVPDYNKYPTYGRSLKYTTGEVGLSGHWIKSLLHYAFIYKAKAYPFWWVIPE